MALLPFGPWTPDFADVAAPGARLAQNCLPAAQGYRDAASAAAFIGVAVTGTDRIAGLWWGGAPGSGADMFVGTDSDIFQWNTGTQAWDDVGRVAAYSLTAEHYWSPVLYGDYVILFGWQEDTQYYQFGVSSLYADISGAPQAKYAAKCKDFVVCAYTWDATDGEQAGRVWWSALGDPTSWTPSAATLADFQDFYELGAITGITGGNFLTILFERGVVRGDFVGGQQIFQFSVIENADGCMVPGSVVQAEGITYYWAKASVIAFDGARARHIGEEIVDHYLFDQLQGGYEHRVSAAYGDRQQIIMWSFPGEGASDGTPNKILAFSPFIDQGRFTEMQISVERLGDASTVSYDVDSAPASLGDTDSGVPGPDDPFWRAAQRVTGAVNTSRKVTAFNGAPLTATIRTRAHTGFPGRTTILNRVVPVVEGGNTTIRGRRVEYRVAHEEPEVGDWVSESWDGSLAIDMQGRYLAVDLEISGGAFHAVGVDVEPRRGGMR